MQVLHCCCCGGGDNRCQGVGGGQAGGDLQRGQSATTAASSNIRLGVAFLVGSGIVFVNVLFMHMTFMTVNRYLAQGLPPPPPVPSPPVFTWQLRLHFLHCRVCSYAAID